MTEVQALQSIVGKWWQDPTQTGLNRLPAHTLVRRYDDAVSAKAGGTSTWQHDLGGPWKFQLIETPEDSPGGWTTADVSNWQTVAVPGNWTMQNVGDDPHYTNVVMPFAGEPPSAPLKNPTGLCRTSFRRPRGWAKRRTILHLGAAESTAAVWCNGTFVGLTTDSRLPSEFDISALVKPSGNELAVLVVRWSSETWIEDQDHWHHGGLHRNVGLVSVGPTSLADVRVTASLNPMDGSGQLEIHARVDAGVDGNSLRQNELATGWTVQTHLEKLNGPQVRGTERTGSVSVLDTSDHASAMRDAYRHPGPIGRTTCDIASVRPWSNEDPYRYRAIVQLIDPGGKVVEAIPILTGFRSMEIRGSELLLNGQAPLIAGVNRHDHHPTAGKTLTEAELRDDVLQIKAAGFNALRTAHYPPDQALLDACDEIGLWVVCEANVETHARWGEVVHDSRFEQAFLERTQRMVRFHYNHPSIIGWSLGNEAGIGAAHDAAAAWARSFDSSRFVQYEGGVMFRWLAHKEASEDALVASVPSTDIECPMYPTLPALQRWGNDVARLRDAKPLIMCEYSHAMGNSNGDLKQYWDLIRTTPGLQGGFIWDWRDQGLLIRNSDGTEFYGYGGVFDDDPHDASFCCNGIVGSDAQPHPALEEHRWLTQPVSTTVRRTPGSETDYVLTIQNNRTFTDLVDMQLTVVVTANGLQRWTKQLRVPKTLPGESSNVALKIPKKARVGTRSDDIRLTSTWTTRSESDWAPADQQVAWDQSRLTVVVDTPSSTHRSTPTSDPSTISVIEGLASIRAEVDGLTIETDRQTGQLVSFGPIGGPNLLVRTPELALWRAPVDNDGVLVGPGARVTGVTPTWLAWGLDKIVSDPVSVSVQRSSKRLLVTSEHVAMTATGIVVTHQRQLLIRPGKPLRMLESVTIPGELSDLPRVGIRMSVLAALSQLRWHGLGPLETYADRKCAQRGLWGSSVAEQYVPYATPQHHGSHTDTDWFELNDAKGAGVRFGLEGLTFDASQYSSEALTSADTTDQLESSEAIEIHIDAALRGVGTGACGPDTSQIVSDGVYEFCWTLAPTSAAS